MMVALCPARSSMISNRSERVVPSIAPIPQSSRTRTLVLAKAGGQLNYKTQDASLVAALHKWFEAQLADHGKDAMEGRASHGVPAKQ